MKAPTVCALMMACVTLLPSSSTSTIAAQPFDHGYTDYGALLRAHVEPPRVDYATLKGNRRQLDQVVASFGVPTAGTERAWSSAQRMAFWINAISSWHTAHRSPADTVPGTAPSSVPS